MHDNPIATIVNVKEVICVAIKQLIKQQYYKGTIELYKSVYRFLERYSYEKFKGNYSIEIGEEFIKEVLKEKPIISNYYFKIHIIAVQRINHILRGDEDWKPNFGKVKEYDSSCFNDVVKNYEAYLLNADKTINNSRGRTHVVARFLHFLDLQGIRSLKELNINYINLAFQATTNSKYAFNRAISAFLNYAYRYSLTTEDFSKMVPSVKIYKRIPSVYTPAEIEVLLSSINRSTPIGKRNYSITLIAARLGLRCCDIVALTFDNINFDSEIIEIVQVKTGQPLTLPLLPEIKDALIDYINNARPPSEYKEIFLKIKKFCDGPLASNYLYTIISRYFNNSSIDIKNRRHGPHALRASLATSLLDEGNNYPIISSILGHVDPNSAKFYVKVDIKHLRSCALSVPLLDENYKRLGEM